jgi:hypothetical protein
MKDSPGDKSPADLVYGSGNDGVPGKKEEVRDQRSEVSGQKSEVRSQKSEVSGQKSEVRSQKSEVRSQKSEATCPEKVGLIR